MVQYTAFPHRFAAMKKRLRAPQAANGLVANMASRMFSTLRATSASGSGSAATAAATTAARRSHSTFLTRESLLGSSALGRNNLCPSLTIALADGDDSKRSSNALSQPIRSHSTAKFDAMLGRRHVAQAAAVSAPIVDIPPVGESDYSRPVNAAHRTVLLDVENPEQTREYIRDYFHATCDKTDDLFEILKGEFPYYHKSEPLRHPPIFYLGHVACFYINKLLLAKIIHHRVNPKIEHMCAVGVDEMSWDDLNTDHYDWPSIAEVTSYRTQVRDLVDNLIVSMPMADRLGWETDWWPILMGIEHENIHTETSSAIFRQIDLEHINPTSKWPICPAGVGSDADRAIPTNELVPIGATEVVFEKSKSNATYYGWDNEFGNKVVPVGDHKASKYLVSNAEFLEFVQDGGYHDKQWWTEEGWTWVSFEAEGGLSGKPKDHPRWWVPVDDKAPTTSRGTDGWKLRCLQEEINMPWSWPACVNQLEAKAFCNWKSAKTGKPLRLPSEPEWYAWRKLGGRGYGDQDQPAWAPNQAPGNINLDHYASECPVDMFAWGDSGLYDVVGNVWQWTESPIDALPGYEVHHLYDDFSSPTFDGLHSLIKGGSWISIGCNGATKDSRYAFRRHFYQHAGFRYVESEAPVDQTMTVMEHDEEVARDLDAQYSLPEVWPGLKPFAVQCADVVREAVATVYPGNNEVRQQLRFAQLGCGVGRTCFELAGDFGETIGFDQTARRIKHAVRLQEGESARYVTPQDGDIQDFHSLSLEALGLDTPAALDPERVKFWTTDACNIDVYKFGTFDVVLAANVLERLYAPREFLDDLHTFVSPGGIAVISTTCNWNPEVTPVENWIGGYKCSTSGENVHTADSVEEILSLHFERVGDDVCCPSVSTQSAQTFTVANSKFSLWRRKTTGD